MTFSHDSPAWVQLASIILTFCAVQVVSISCVDLSALSNGNPGLPLQPDPRWRIVDVRYTFVRFQSPDDTLRGGTGNLWDSKVTRLDWQATRESVSATFNNYNNGGGTNDQLWNWGDLRALVYAGYMKPDCDVYDFQAQQGLADDRAVASYSKSTRPSPLILLISLLPGPNGHPNVATVSQLVALTGPNSNRIDAFGLSGTITPGDYAYATGFEVKGALNQRYFNLLKNGRQNYRGDEPYVLAETADPTTCVVLDFSKLPSHEVRVRDLSPNAAPGSSVRFTLH